MFGPGGHALAYYDLTAPALMPLGRPTTYTPEIAAVLIERIASGESMRSICRDDEMPGLTTVYGWLDKHEDFSKQYARAREDQADTLADQIVDIADSEPDPQRARVMVDARKWVASKLKPRRYGEATTLRGDPDAPLKASITVEFVGAPPAAPAKPTLNQPHAGERGAKTISGATRNGRK